MPKLLIPIPSWCIGDRSQFPGIQPDKLAIRAGIDYECSRTIIGMSGHLFFADGAVDLAKKFFGYQRALSISRTLGLNATIFDNFTKGQLFGQNSVTIGTVISTMAIDRGSMKFDIANWALNLVGGFPENGDTFFSVVDKIKAPTVFTEIVRSFPE
jgi:hypothetical protein